MAINCYCGLQGSGKSFETVRSVILPAVRSGRRVVTNIDGLDYEKIVDYLKQKHPQDDLELYGKILKINNEDVKLEYLPSNPNCPPSFFPVEDHPEHASIVKGGDILVIDEAWRFWGIDTGRIPVSHMTFFRMHRHYTDEKGRTCDVVLVTQDITGLHRSVKNVIEFSFRMVKLKSIGAPTAYRVECYEGWKHTKKTRNDTYVHKYDKKIFPLYKSYDAGAGTESNIDKRQNILSNPKYMFIAVLILVFFALAFGYLYWFFTRQLTPKNEKPSKNQTTKPTNPNQANKPTDQNNKNPHKVDEPRQTEFSEDYRLAGRISGKFKVYVIADNRGRFRYESPSKFTGEWPISSTKIEDRKVTSFTGLPENIANAKARYD